MSDIGMKLRGASMSAAPLLTAIGFAITSALAAGACSSESVTAVAASAVSVTPPQVSTVAGEQVRFAATIRDDRDVMLESARPTWTSEDESVVAIDSDGVARALAPGSALVVARFGGATGTALFRVIDQSSPPTDPDGDGDDSGDGSGGDDGGGGGGGIEIVEAHDGTVVSEAPGEANLDSLSVVLTEKPIGDVVVAVVSENVLEVLPLTPLLRFTSSTWSQPQAVVLAGVDDLHPDGDQTTVVTLVVDALLSDPAFEGVLERVSVTTVDDDVPLPTGR